VRVEEERCLRCRCPRQTHEIQKLTLDQIADLILDALGDDSTGFLFIDSEREAALARAIARQTWETGIATAHGLMLAGRLVTDLPPRQAGV
jgi:hypothetical protein